MKKILYTILISLFLVFCQHGYTQPPPPSQHGQSGDQEPSAPIGGGLLILAGLGLVYAAGKVYAGRKRDEELRS